ncbi:apolipoprotein A-I-like [Siniperca chuatsi]|uniref:apolipoprotein A-I-like n=1 Tax=Siniperca chuatsi TaxID=119488 RepID=UPI001CE0E3B6|nr:apolipoprotein A-I-like [Siniperca chuatsi]XP_044057296.1 apolipoprotein A-I-like [Siniperca chuatsi]
MKFVALALALLLAVGSQAASLQADAPSQLDQIRSAVDLYLTQLKDSANKALDNLDGTEYSTLKASLSERMDQMYNQIKEFQKTVSPITDNVVTTISDATADFRTTVMSDIEALRAKYEPEREKLKEIIERHIADYRAQIEPIITEYHTKHAAEMESLKVKLEPIVEQLRDKVAVNVEETKTALMPIVDAVRAKLSERLENLKALATPYVEEYKDKLTQSYNQAQTISNEEITALQEKIAPLAAEIKDKLKAIFEAITATVTKN